MRLGTKMNLPSIVVVLGLFGGVWAQNATLLLPNCDSPDAEEAALVAQDFLNAQHKHGYKYALNQIEDIKVHTELNGDSIYVMEVELLETDCHVLDPTPVVNCTVRPKHLTAVEGDCDFVLKKVGTKFTVTAFKCKTEESSEKFCGGCHSLLPLNHTEGLDFVQASLSKLNNETENVTYSLLEIGRITSQVVSGGQRYIAEFVIIEAPCLGDLCMRLNNAPAARGICSSEGRDDPIVTCNMFPSMLVPVGNGTADNGTAGPSLLLQGHIHVGNHSHKHGFGHHKLTPLHNPHMSGYLSAESAESTEVVPVAPAPVLPVLAPAANDSSASDGSDSTEVPLAVVKRDVPATLVADPSATPVRLCPGRIRFF